jgi:hypothetical protein
MIRDTSKVIHKASAQIVGGHTESYADNARA